jgi:hypothetical protein
VVDCVPPPLGGGGGVGPPPAQLYDVSSGRWTSVVIPSRLCYFATGGSCGVAGVGAHWLKIAQVCYHCSASYFLLNVQTGATEPDPASPGGTVFDDLNSLSGATRLCAPLRYPKSYDPALGTGQWALGGLAFYGRFALAGGAKQNMTNYDYVERCGSRLRVNFTTNSRIVASARAVVWEPGPTSLHGVFLPSLRAFTIPLPNNLRAAHAAIAALTRRTLYVLGDDGTFRTGQLWAATMPSR